MDEADIKAIIAKLKAADWDADVIDDELSLMIHSEAIIRMLVECRDNPDIQVQEDAAWILQKIQATYARPNFLIGLMGKWPRKRGDLPQKPLDPTDIESVMASIRAVKWNPEKIDEDLRKAVRLPEIMAELVKRLGDEDFIVRSDAGFALAEIAGEIAKPELIKALSSDRWQARAEAAGRSWYYKDPSLVQYLIPLLRDPEMPVRISAAESIGMLGDSSTVPHLIEAIKDSNLKLFDYATYALRDIAEGNEVPELFPYLKSENVYLRIAAAYALGAKGGKDAVQGLIDLVRVGMSGDKTEFEHARDELRLIGEPVVEELIEALNEREVVLSLMAIEVLAFLGDLRALPHIVAAMTDENDQIYEAATWGASEFGEVAIPLLLNLLKSENSVLRANAANALGHIEDASVVDDLVKLLEDSDSNVRREALWGLERIGDVRTVEQIIPLLRGSARVADSEWMSTAYYAAQVLQGKLATPEALAAVERWKKEEAGKGI